MQFFADILYIRKLETLNKDFGKQYGPKNEYICIF